MTDQGWLGLSGQRGSLESGHLLNNISPRIYQDVFPSCKKTTISDQLVIAGKHSLLLIWFVLDI